MTTGNLMEITTGKLFIRDDIVIEMVKARLLGKRWEPDHHECVDCGTRYAVMNGHLRCNGHNITLCPWCRPDYKEGRNGA